MKLIYWVFIFQILFESVCSPYTTMGSHFLLSLPGMAKQTSNRIVFYLYTNHNSNFKVTITTENFIHGKRLQTALQLSKFGPANYSLPSEYHFNTGAGLKWTLRFLGNFDFGLTVLMSEEHLVATFVAIPVDSWGRIYYAVTFSHRPYVVIVAYEATDVTLDISHFQSNATSLLEVTVNQLMVILNGTDKITLSLERYGAIDISGCSNSTSSLTGANIVSNEPIGVVSGSCGGLLYQHAQNCGKGLAQSDMAAEMLAPQETFGKVFITPVLTLQNTRGSLLVVASKSDTLIRYIEYRGSSKEVTLTSPGNVLWLPASLWISGSEPIAVYHVQHSSCSSTTFSSVEAHDNSEMLGMSISLVVPVELFYFRYVFSVPSISGAKHYVILIINNVRRQTLVLDGEYISERLTWDNMLGTHSYAQAVTAVHEGAHRATTVDFSGFGCYLYGHKSSHSYMYPAGYRTLRINLGCEQKFVIPKQQGQVTDNDCDQDVDEEKDDNTDEIFTEDMNEDSDKGVFVGLPDRQDSSLKGILEEWGVWHCAQDCTEYRLVRTRKCLPIEHGRRPVCKEQLLEYGIENACYTDTLCPGQCPSYSWGMNCLHNCSRCYQPCNKFNGTCRRCKAGFKGAKHGCNLTCDQFEFGQDCMGNCLTKCDGEDCLDRVTGECNTSRIYFVIIFLFALVIPCCAVICSGKSKPYNVSEDYMYQEVAMANAHVQEEIEVV